MLIDNACMLKPREALDQQLACRSRALLRRRAGARAIDSWSSKSIHRRGP